MFVARLFSVVIAASAIAIPPGTPVTVQLDAPISSGDAKTGAPFTFHAARDVIIDGATVIAAGAPGSGTVVLGGRSGSGGHEGNLRLRFDTIRAVDGSDVRLDATEQWNGKARKAASFLLGFVPIAGYAATLIRGDDVVVPVDRDLTYRVAPPLTTPSTPAPAASP